MGEIIHRAVSLTIHPVVVHQMFKTNCLSSLISVNSLTVGISYFQSSELSQRDPAYFPQSISSKRSSWFTIPTNSKKEMMLFPTLTLMHSPPTQNTKV